MTLFVHTNLCSSKATLCSMSPCHPAAVVTPCPSALTWLPLCRVCPLLLPRLGPLLCFPCFSAMLALTGRCSTKGWVRLAPSPVCRANSAPVQKPCQSLFIFTLVSLEPHFQTGLRWRQDLDKCSTPSQACWPRVCSAPKAPDSAKPQRRGQLMREFDLLHIPLLALALSTWGDYTNLV